MGACGWNVAPWPCRAPYSAPARPRPGPPARATPWLVGLPGLELHSFAQASPPRRAARASLPHPPIRASAILRRPTRRLTTRHHRRPLRAPSPRGRRGARGGSSRTMGDWMKWGSDMASYARNSAATVTTMVAGSELEKRLAEATSNEPGARAVRDDGRHREGDVRLRRLQDGDELRVEEPRPRRRALAGRVQDPQPARLPPPPRLRARRRGAAARAPPAARAAPSAAASRRRGPRRRPPRGCRTRATTCARSSGSSPSSSSTPTARTRASTCARRRSSWWSCWTRRTRAS